MVEIILKIEKHVWERGQTNEYCIHCVLIYESDLGWSSADGVKCITRNIEYSNTSEMPEEIKSYVNFRGLRWNKIDKIFFKSFSSDTFTINQILEIIKELKNDKTINSCNNIS